MKFFPFLLVLLCAALTIGANAMAICIGADCPKGVIARRHNGATKIVADAIRSIMTNNTASLPTKTTAPDASTIAETAVPDRRHVFRIHFGGHFQRLSGHIAPSAAVNDTTHPFLSVNFGSSHPFFSFSSSNPFSRLNMTEIWSPLEQFMMTLTMNQFMGLMTLIPEADRTWTINTRSVSVEESDSPLKDEGLIRNPVDVLILVDAATDTNSGTVIDHELESRGYPRLKGTLPRIKLSFPKIFRYKGELRTAGFKKGLELKGKEWKDALTIIHKALAGGWWSAIGANTDKQIAKPHEKRDTFVFWCDSVNTTRCDPESDNPKDANISQKLAVQVADILSTSYLGLLKEIKNFGPQYINSPRFFETNAAEVRFISLLNDILENHHGSNVTATDLQTSFDDWSKILNWTLKEWKTDLESTIEITVGSISDAALDATVLDDFPTLVERHSIMGTSPAELRAAAAMRGALEGKGYHLSPLKDVKIPDPIPEPVPYHEHYKTEVERIAEQAMSELVGTVNIA